MEEFFSIFHGYYSCTVTEKYSLYIVGQYRFVLYSHSTYDAAIVSKEHTELMPYVSNRSSLAPGNSFVFG